MEKWKCNKCDYVYNPEKGDISQDTPKETKFEKLPDGWHCPKCHGEKGKFKRL